MVKWAGKLEPGRSFHWIHVLGRVLEEQGRDAEAIPEYRAAISLDPVQADPCDSLGLLYRRLNRSGEADAAFAEYRKRKTDVTSKN